MAGFRININFQNILFVKKSFHLFNKKKIQYFKAKIFIVNLNPHNHCYKIRTNSIYCKMSWINPKIELFTFF